MYVSVCMCVCVCVYVCVYVSVCMCVHVYCVLCMYTHTHTPSEFHAPHNTRLIVGGLGVHGTCIVVVVAAVHW